jgi:5-methylcytosine-specific restriction protein A
MRNPAWTREELILALNLYFRIGFPNVSGSHPEIAKLMALLQELPFHINRGPNFRNPTGVYMKLCDFPTP